MRIRQSMLMHLGASIDIHMVKVRYVQCTYTPRFGMLLLDKSSELCQVCYASHGLEFLTYAASCMCWCYDELVQSHGVCTSRPPVCPLTPSPHHHITSHPSRQ